MKVQVKLSKLYKQYPKPAYATPGSAGMDLRVDTGMADILMIPPGRVRMADTGVSMWLGYEESANIPGHRYSPGYAGVVVPRSGLGSRGLVLGNTAGIIDSDYQGEINLALWNRTGAPITINRGQAVAQLLIVPVVQAELVVVDEFDAGTERGAGGFGSTG